MPIARSICRQILDGFYGIPATKLPAAIHYLRHREFHKFQDVSVAFDSHFPVRHLRLVSEHLCAQCHEPQSCERGKELDEDLMKTERSEALKAKAQRRGRRRTHFLVLLKVKSP